jgi:hypothetical protein
MQELYILILISILINQIEGVLILVIHIRLLVPPYGWLCQSQLGCGSG